MIFDRLFRKDAPENEDTRLDIDRNGKPLYREDIISFVKAELEERRIARKPIEDQWTLNANMLIGNQYCDINTYMGQIKQLKPVHDWLERETFNQIAPLIETRVANLKKVTYDMRCKPHTNEYDDYAKAEVSTEILRHIQDTSDFDRRNNTAIEWNELCGNVFWLSWWDSEKGERRKFISADAGETEGAEAYVEICEGDLDYGLASAYEVFPESLYKESVENQRSIILEQVKSVDEIYDLYGISVDGREVETFSLTPVASGYGVGKESAVMSLGRQTVKDAETVITYFERKSRRYPNGRMIIVCADELIYYGDLPYGQIPLVQMVCREVPGQFFGKSVIEDLIPRQRAYNGCMNRIHEYIKRIVIQSYIAEDDAIDIEAFEEEGQSPGYILTYARGSNPPTPVPNGNLPSEVMTERYNLVRDMEYVAGVSQLMTSGSAPSGVTSGVALDAIRATDDTRLSLTGDHIRESVRKLAKVWLGIYKIYASSYRVLNSFGSNGIGSVLVWNRDDITDDDVEFVAENELLYSDEAQKENFLAAFQMGLFTNANGRVPQRVKQRAIEYMKVNGYSELMNINALQLQAAQRENVLFTGGVIPQINDFDDHEIHIEEHMRYVLQQDFYQFKRKKPEYAKILEEHIKEHQRIYDATLMQSAQNQEE